MNEQKTKTLVLGLGNPILTDDSAGYRVAMALRGNLRLPGVDIKDAGVAGLDFLDMVVGYDRLVIIDAIQTAKGKPGRIYRFGPEALLDTLHSGTPHDINIATALELGKRLEMDLPEDITIFAIEAEDVMSFSENCTPAIARAIPKCADMVIRELQIAS